VVRAKQTLIPANDALDFEFYGFHLAATKHRRDLVREEVTGASGLPTSVGVVE
jgi:hypothetical protein